MSCSEMSSVTCVLLYAGGKNTSIIFNMATEEIFGKDIHKWHVSG